MKKKIILAPNDTAISLQPFIDKVMSAFGFDPNDVLITDASSVGDFRTIEDRDKFRSHLNEIGKKLGVDIKYEWKMVEGHAHVECDYIIDIARRLKGEYSPA